MFIVKNTTSKNPDTIYRFTLIDVTYINTCQVRGVNITLFNILFKYLKEKKNET